MKVIWKILLAALLWQVGAMVVGYAMALILTSPLLFTLLLFFGMLILTVGCWFSIKLPKYFYADLWSNRFKEGQNPLEEESNAH